MTIFGGWASEAERDAALERFKGWKLLYCRNYHTCQGALLRTDAHESEGEALREQARKPGPGYREAFLDREAAADGKGEFCLDAITRGWRESGDNTWLCPACAEQTPEAP